MDVRAEQETAEEGRGLRGGGGGGGCVLEISKQTDRRACVHAWPTRGEADRTRACPPGDLPYERGPRTTDHSDEGVIITLNAS